MEFLQYLKKKRAKITYETLIFIKETKKGILTYSHPNIENMDTPYKAQISRFLEDIIKRLK